jgi:hypothetical protein
MCGPCTEYVHGSPHHNDSGVGLHLWPVLFHQFQYFDAGQAIPEVFIREACVVVFQEAGTSMPRFGNIELTAVKALPSLFRISHGVCR